jgi:hypothetical protein
MKTIFEHIEYAKSKPHHIRKRIAFTAAATITAVVALVWFFGTLSSGAFAIQGSTFAESTGAEPTVVNNPGSSNAEGVAGAAAALPDENAPAHIEIINSSPATSSENQAEQTTIPF